MAPISFHEHLLSPLLFSSMETQAVGSVALENGRTSMSMTVLKNAAVEADAFSVPNYSRGRRRGSARQLRPQRGVVGTGESRLGPGHAAREAMLCL